MNLIDEEIDRLSSRIRELEAQRDAAGNEGMRLASRVAQLEAALRCVVAGLPSGEVGVDIALMAQTALRGSGLETVVKSPALTTTKCWSCAASYNIKVPSCPYCGATNR